MNNVFTFTVEVKENVKCSLCLLTHGRVFVSTGLQHRVLAPDKHGVHFPVLERIFDF